MMPQKNVKIMEPKCSVKKIRFETELKYFDFIN